MAVINRVLTSLGSDVDVDPHKAAWLLKACVLWSVLAASFAGALVAITTGLLEAMLPFYIAFGALLVLVTGLALAKQVTLSALLACFGWVLCTYLPFISYPIMNAVGAVGLLAIPVTGVLLNHHAVRAVSLFYATVSAVVYGYCFAASGLGSVACGVSMVLLPAIGLILGLLLEGIMEGRIRLHYRLTQGEAALAKQNEQLAAEIAERRQAQARQSAIMASLESIMRSADGLLATQSLDELWRVAVEMARERLGFERVSIFLYEADRGMLVGTYGTDMSGRTTDERAVSIHIDECEYVKPLVSEEAGVSRWVVNAESRAKYYTDTGEVVNTGVTCWTASTPIRTRAGTPMGLIFNDSAISGSALDPVQQDLLVVYASLISNIAQQKQLERRLHETNADLERRAEARALELTASEQRFRSLVQHSNDVFVIVSSDGALSYVNPAFCRLTGYSMQDALWRNVYELLAPSDLAWLRERAPDHLDLLAALGLHAPVQVGIRCADGHILEIEVAGVARPSESNLYYITAHDISERKRAEAAVERQVALERIVSALSTKFLAMPLDKLHEGIDFAFNVVGEFVGADICRMFLFSDDGLVINNTHEWTREGVPSQRHLLQHLPAEQWRMWRKLLVERGVVQLDTIEALKPLDPLGYADMVARRVGAAICAPLLQGGRFIGQIGFDMLEKSRNWSEEDLSLLRLCAGLIGNAIGRAQAIQMLREERNLLEMRVAERTAVLSKVLEISNGLTALTDPGSLVSHTLERLRELINYDTASISTLGEDGDLHLMSHVNGDVFSATDSWDYLPQEDVHIARALQGRVAVAIDDVLSDSPFARAFRARFKRRLGLLPDGIRSALYVPLIFQDRVIGLLAVTHSQPGYYSPQRRDLAQTFANYVAAALENSNVHHQSVRAAALEERSRLARELHDSVSQALFGVVLGTRTALHRISDAPAEAEDPMKYVLSLAEAALAEMRALIFELRPESLQQQGLIGAFRKQAEALCARHKIDVRVDFDAKEPSLDMDQKEALYRVALEAIQNTIKHAQATRVDLILNQTSEAVYMEVIDNGLGFDTSVQHDGHYGLLTMRERIVRFGGDVTISSKIGEGTVVRVWVPQNRRQKPRTGAPDIEMAVA